MRFTDSKIKGLKPKNKRYIIWETGTGLGIRVEPTGTLSFCLFYRINGKGVNYTLGRYPVISLAQARSKAAQALEMAAKGIDPGDEKKAKKTADREAFTVSALVDEYLEKWAKPRKRTWREDERCLKREVIPYLGTQKAKDIRRRDIILILDRIMERGSGGMANRTLNVITKLFNFAVSRDIINGSPCVGISTPAKKNQRDRVLDEGEIRKFWNGLPDSGISIPIQFALKLMLATGQRRGEVVSAEWAEFNLSEKWWIIPAKKSKNGLSHRVPLSVLSLKILDEIQGISRDSKFIFPSPRTGTHIDPRAITRSLRKAQNYFGMDKEFRPHDLRRSAASQMTGMGIPRLTVSKILNHVEGGVTAVYDRYGYDLEKRKALEAWSRKLESIITGEPQGKIIELKR